MIFACAAASLAIGTLKGEHYTIEFLNSVGIDYVSCSPFRVPIARLAAAQAKIKQSK